MFELYYRVVHSEYDDFVGQNGFFQIKCNECKYGEIYPKELETVMDKVSLYDWFERLARVIKYLSLKDYVALSDVESYNTWIEFRKTNEEVMGKKSRIWKINRGIMEGCAGIGTLFHLPLNTERLRKLTENYVVSNAKIKAALGIDKMPVTAKEGLIKTIKSFE